MYNVTPHGTTGKSPSELIYNRRIRDKIPCLDDIATDPIDEETYDQDLTNKAHGKDKEDKRRKAFRNEITPGDKVLVKNMIFPHKLTPNFANDIYDVTERHGNELTLYREGKVVKRNIAHVKKVPEPFNLSLQTASSSSMTSTSSPSTPTSEMETTASSETYSNDSKDLDQSEGPLEPLKPLKLVKDGGMWRPVNTD